MTRLPELPIHEVPAEIAQRPPNGDIEIAGLVARPGRISAGTLARLAHVQFDGEFGCEEGWSVPGLHWEGVALEDLIAVAAPQPAVAYVRVCSGGFCSVLPLEEAKTAVLCNVLDDLPLGLEHGGPWRLLVPGGLCHTSVKWVDRIEFSDQPGENTAETIAMARIGRG
ncbi:MAG: molybdopterin-dependent oxidoreductase [Dehalococcoidia bacterium]|nr:molybdopterin-dependent oxidoreductase [Dehalococcoidia bacterium]MCB9486687.1 molybdopterin-dependent oxidoreductase [Thermoflexaceae bacterium]